MTFPSSSKSMFEAVAELVDSTEANGLDVHTIVLQLNGQHGEFDLWVRSSDEELEEYETDATAHRAGGISQVRYSSGNRLTDHRPLEHEIDRIVGVHTEQSKALDARRTKRRFNTPWRETEPGMWTTRPTDYAHQLYDYYVVRRVPLK